MTSGPHIQPHASPAPTVDRSGLELRLRLKPKGSLAGHVDGAWWPRSRDLTVELPALVHVLGVRLGGVSRVAFPLEVWDLPPRKITVDGRLIRMEGFHEQDEHIVYVSGPDRRRLSLLVIPPDTAARAAHDAMTASSARDNTDRPGDILAAAAGTPATAPRLRLVRAPD